MEEEKEPKLYDMWEIPDIVRAMPYLIIVLGGFGVFIFLVFCFFFDQELLRDIINSFEDNRLTWVICIFVVEFAAGIKDYGISTKTHRKEYFDVKSKKYYEGSPSLSTAIEHNFGVICAWIVTITVILLILAIFLILLINFPLYTLLAGILIALIVLIYQNNHKK